MTGTSVLMRLESHMLWRSMWVVVGVAEVLFVDDGSSNWFSEFELFE